MFWLCVAFSYSDAMRLAKNETQKLLAPFPRSASFISVSLGPGKASLLFITLYLQAPSLHTPLDRTAKLREDVYKSMSANRCEFNCVFRLPDEALSWVCPLSEHGQKTPSLTFAAPERLRACVKTQIIPCWGRSPACLYSAFRLRNALILRIFGTHAGTPQPWPHPNSWCTDGGGLFLWPKKDTSTRKSVLGRLQLWFIWNIIKYMRWEEGSRV